MKPGDWVTVRPEHDIPAIFRAGGRPTRGRVDEVDGETVTICVPIGDEDINVHSQAVFYSPDQLVPA